MDVITNSTSLRASSFRYKVHSRIIQNLLDKYYSHQLFTRFEPLLSDIHDWEQLTACKLLVLSNTYYAHLTSEYGITYSTLKRSLAKSVDHSSVEMRSTYMKS